MKSRRFTIPAPFFTSREVLTAVTPYYLRPANPKPPQPAEMADPVLSSTIETSEITESVNAQAIPEPIVYKPSVPAVLSFETDTFIDDFLVLTSGERSEPRLLPWRDWSEPPPGIVSLSGALLAADNVRRNDPPMRRLRGDQNTVYGIYDHDYWQEYWENSPAASDAWFRKLYLPQHERFTLVAFDLICQRAGLPPLNRERVVEAGLVIRRLSVPPPTQQVGEEEQTEYWEDWVAIDERQGLWIRFLDSKMQPEKVSTLVENENGTPEPWIDPARIPLSAFQEAERTTVEELLETARGNGNGQGAPELTAALSSAPLMLVPANRGDAANHCSFYGYVPVFSAAREVRPEPKDRTQLLQELHDHAESVLTSLFSDPSRLVPNPGDLVTLLTHTILPTWPTSDAFDQASQGIGLTALAATNQEIETIITAIDILLRRAIHQLCLYALDKTRSKLWKSDKSFCSGLDLWTASSADLHQLDFTRELNLPLPGDPGGDTKASWVTRKLESIDHSKRDILVRARLHDLICYWCSISFRSQVNNVAISYTWPQSTPPIDQSTILSSVIVEMLVAAGLFRLRYSQALMLNDVRHSFDLLVDDTLAASDASEVDAFLAMEEERENRGVMPWDELNSPVYLAFKFAVPLPPLREAHDAAIRLAASGRAFVKQLAEAGTAVTHVLKNRADSKPASLKASFAQINAGASLHMQIPELPLNIDWKLLGMDFFDQPALSLLAFPGVTLQPAEARKVFEAFKNDTQAYYVADPNPDPEIFRNEAIARSQHQPLRFDDEHLYAVWCWVRVAGRHPCERERVIWTGRSEPFSIAEPLDLLGSRPTSIRMPNLPRLVRDLGRMARAKSNPFAAVISPEASGIDTSDVGSNITRVGKTKRDMGLGFVCTYGIPVFTICALILFSIIFSILIAIPGFMWMLFLKICLPVPKKT